MKKLVIFFRKRLGIIIIVQIAIVALVGCDKNNNQTNMNDQDSSKPQIEYLTNQEKKGFGLREELVVIVKSRDLIGKVFEFEILADEDHQDSDGDMLYDYEEIEIFGTDPNNPDTDGDSISDGNEVQAGMDPLTKIVVPVSVGKVDTDNDGIYDHIERGQYQTDPNNPDTDGDGVGDREEIRLGSDPNSSD